MKVLSIRQPWASLIVYGYKKYEFRSWKTKYRGEFLIHASKMVEKDNLERFKHLNIPFPTGVIMGKAYLEEVLEMDKELEEKLKKENALVYGKSLTRGAYAFKLRDITKLDNYIEVKGKLGFWNFSR